MDLCILLLKPSVSGWKVVDKECLQPKALIKQCQKREINHGLQSDTIKQAFHDTQPCLLGITKPSQQH